MILRFGAYRRDFAGHDGLALRLVRYRLSGSVLCRLYRRFCPGGGLCFLFYGLLGLFHFCGSLGRLLSRGGFRLFHRLGGLCRLILCQVLFSAK
mgnify:CR=1 FL=1